MKKNTHRFNEKILDRKKTYIVAVSGGPDSMFCLEKLRIKKYKLIVVHVNYKKRKESWKDELIVKDYCQKNSIKLEIASPKKREIKENFQAWARDFRYQFLESVAKKYKSKNIIVAHHQDDLIETYLMQKRRKSLVQHYGLNKKTKRGNFHILRPILSFKKKEILTYLKKKKIEFANDITNESLIYQRNKVRNHLKDLDFNKRKLIIKNIDDENKALHKLRRETSKLEKELISKEGYFYWSLMPIETEFDKKIRLIYFWMNKFSDQEFAKKKKKIVKEIYKQIFISKKKKIEIKLNKFWSIKKNSLFANLEKNEL